MDLETRAVLDPKGQLTPSTNVDYHRQHKTDPSSLKANPNGQMEPPEADKKDASEPVRAIG